jgi:hypothetical protein
MRFSYQLGILIVIVLANFIWPQYRLYSHNAKIADEAAALERARLEEEAQAAYAKELEISAKKREAEALELERLKGEIGVTVSIVMRPKIFPQDGSGSVRYIRGSILPGADHADLEIAPGYVAEICNETPLKGDVIARDASGDSGIFQSLTVNQSCLVMDGDLVGAVSGWKAVGISRPSDGTEYPTQDDPFTGENNSPIDGEILILQIPHDSTKLSTHKVIPDIPRGTDLPIDMLPSHYLYITFAGGIDGTYLIGFTDTTGAHELPAGGWIFPNPGTNVTLRHLL